MKIAIRREKKAHRAIAVGLTMVIIFGSALDSEGWAGWVAVAGVLAGFGLIGGGIRAERKAKEKSRQKTVV